MVNIKDIENKEQELNEIVRKYKKEIKNMQWQYIKEQYDLYPGCVCRVKDSYAVLDSIHTFVGQLIYINFKKIKKNGEIGGNTTSDSPLSVTKEFNSYDEYKKALDNL